MEVATSAKHGLSMKKLSARIGTTGRSAQPVSTGSTWARAAQSCRVHVISAGLVLDGRGTRRCKAGSSVIPAADGALCQTLPSGRLTLTSLFSSHSTWLRTLANCACQILCSPILQPSQCFQQSVSWLVYCAYCQYKSPIIV